MSEALHPLVRLAEEAITVFLAHQRVIEPPAMLFAEIPEAGSPAAAFVCLKREGRLRGCVGTTEPAQGTLAAEIIENAISAATRDPRFPPLQRFELDALAISVDVLEPIEAVPDLSMLDPRLYGVIVRSGERRGVLLPDLEGIESVVQQVSVAREKAGIKPDEPVELLRFKVKRYR